MAFTTDKFYYYTKDTHKKELLGNNQVGEEGFNMSFVIDGTKDSCRAIVCSYSMPNAIEPQTIILHENTSTWWVVSSDKVERYINESGYYYVHSLNLVGAIELLNARDLTDCAFNNDTYTIRQVINRLFSLSTFEFGIWLNSNNEIDLDANVDYVKTFENYTLLSALREFLDGYNMSAKMWFNEVDGYLTLAGLDFISKAGNQNLDSYDFDDFDDVKQINTMDKNSFGTTVVSNAENVISTQAKVYPLVGGIRPSANAYQITPSNAILRLPSNIHHVNWVKMINLKPKLSIKNGLGDGVITSNFDYDPTNQGSIDSAYQQALDKLAEMQVDYPGAYNEIQQAINDMNTNEAVNKQLMKDYCEITLNNVENYDPVNERYTDFPQYCFNGIKDSRKNYLVGPESLRNGVAEPETLIYWKKGDNAIKGFDFFNWNRYSLNSGNVIQYTGYYSSLGVFHNWQSQTDIFYHYDGISGFFYIGLEDTRDYVFKDTAFVVNYVPMSDLKVKIDNRSTTNDIQMYNQNGRLTDSNALSRLLLSYSNEISSENITKYKSYYSFWQVPKVGSKVSRGNDIYTINNMSVQFYLNEDTYNNGNQYNYYCECEITMSKYVATKSLLTNPNTNIRDYGIPQNNTVKRKELFRDFWELDYTSDTNADNDYYLPFNKTMNLSIQPQDSVNHIAIIKTTYANGESWYYQLDTICYSLKKSIYEVVDFNDNNIIGYDMQNATCGFDITRILSGLYDSINTPVSYTDSKGEIKDIDICYCTPSQLLSNYLDLAEQGHVFISQTTYDNSVNNCDFAINYPNYYKDALEIPFIEYSCQIDDTDNVLIGENILDINTQSDSYLYSYVYATKGVANQNNAMSFYDPSNVWYDWDNGYWRIYNLIDFNTLTQNQVKVRLFESGICTRKPPRISLNGSALAIDTTKDLLIFRTKTLDTQIQKTELVMILRNTDLAENIDLNVIDLYANHYKIR